VQTKKRPGRGVYPQNTTFTDRICEVLWTLILGDIYSIESRRIGCYGLRLLAEI
jgi:hypothetical protein